MRKMVLFNSTLTKLELTENSILNKKTADAERIEAGNIVSEPFTFMASKAHKKDLHDFIAPTVTLTSNNLGMGQ